MESSVPGAMTEQQLENLAEEALKQGEENYGTIVEDPNSRTFIKGVAIIFFNDVLERMNNEMLLIENGIDPTIVND